MPQANIAHQLAWVSRRTLTLNEEDDDDGVHLSELYASVESCTAFHRQVQWLWKADLYPENLDFAEGRQTLLTCTHFAVLPPVRAQPTEALKNYVAMK